MPLQLKFHGALTTVTGSCHFFKVKKSGNIYAVDCGATQGNDEEKQLALPANLPADCRPEKLSGIILTHAHGDHISHLPRWFQAGFKGQIFCTKETAKLADIALKDGKRIETDNKRWDVDEKAFKDTLDGLKSAKHVQPGEVELLEHEVTIEGAQTSHLLGCCAYRIKARDGEKTSTILYTGDIGPIEHDDETQSLYAERQRHKETSDYIVSESTYGARPRSKESQSGRRRLAKVCDMLSKAFRHDGDSVVVIPAFSLQRSLDILTDVFCALQYRRADVGITKSCVPLIMVKSPLSWDCAQAFRDFYYDEVNSGHVFFNKHSLLLKLIHDAGDDEIGVIDDLIPLDDKKSGFDGNEIIERLDESDDKIRTEIAWGRGADMAGRPTVIICGSGMTHTGPIIDLFDEYLDKDFATFVLCGFVPPKSPGFQLRQLWPMSLMERAAQSIKLPGDKRKGKPAKIIPGDEVKCGFESLSEYYSGHADGASIIRYILGDKCERAQATKGIFLVHGDKDAREELHGLIVRTCNQAGVNAPAIHRPYPLAGWFDCEAAQFENKGGELLRVSSDGEILAMSQDLHAESDTPVLAASPKLPASIELETCVILNNNSDEDDIMDQALGAFDFARPELKGDDLLLKLGRPGVAHSTILLQAVRIGGSLLRLSAQTRIKQVTQLADIAEISFDWRRLLNLLGVPKELYFAGVRWCQTDSEIERLFAICAPCVYGTKQRRQPVLIIHADTLTQDEFVSIERLLTPSVVVAIVHEPFVSRINQHFGITGALEFSRANPIYLPIKFNAGVIPMRSESHGVDLERLSEVVSADTFILNAREPQILRSGHPSPLTQPVSESAPALSEKIPTVRKSTHIKLASPKLDYALFTTIAVGQKFAGLVQYVRHKKNSQELCFALVNIQPTGITGMLHFTQMSRGFKAEAGDAVEVTVRQVDSDQQKIYLTQLPLRLPTDAFLHGIETGEITNSNHIAELLDYRVSADSVANAAFISLQQQGDLNPALATDTTLDRGTLIDTYNRVIQEFGLIDTLSVAIPETPKGVTYGDVASQLGYTLDDVANAAGHMIGDESTYRLGMTVLPAGFTPTEASPFPADQVDAFINECRNRSKKNWSKELDLKSALKPDCLSLASLAMSMGITEAELLSLMSEKGIQPKVQVVLTAHDIVKLKG